MSWIGPGKSLSPISRSKISLALHQETLTLTPSSHHDTAMIQLKVSNGPPCAMLCLLKRLLIECQDDAELHRQFGRGNCGMRERVEDETGGHDWFVPDDTCVLKHHIR